MQMIMDLKTKSSKINDISRKGRRRQTKEKISQLMTENSFSFENVQKVEKESGLIPNRGRLITLCQK